jgi:hypothetical protein
MGGERDKFSPVRPQAISGDAARIGMMEEWKIGMMEWRN